MVETPPTLADSSASNEGTQTQNSLRLKPKKNSIDSTNPLYFHPSDSPGMVLVNSVFDGKGYGGWRRGILIALSAKNKVGFIDGTLSQPPSSSDLSKTWTRCNDMISESVQGNLDVASYYTKLKRLWDELDSLDITQHCNCDCTCGGKSKTNKSQQDGRLIQFLMGLNDAYIGARSTLLLMSPLPSVNHAYSLLIRDEKQRESHDSQRYNYDKKPSYEGKGNNNNLFCTYCKKTNHTIGRCYRLIGFPADFKFTKSKKYPTSAKSNATMTHEETILNSTSMGDKPMT
ncbi:uncharacterized protein LOC132033581 [Lycium ferocissimum]|uniref:uncharacterized protein LOC132033581 n=1 Tax=Lycium ferocissimum TaxID=112874 RepID=UPI00281645AA|nr:uncharacterized protein LOC132033581 [Lycium ferocissimum]